MKQGLLDRNPMTKAVRAETGTADPAAMAANVSDGDEFAEGEQATPEEQAAYESYIRAAVKILYEDDNGHSAVMDLLKNEPNKIKAAIDATILTLKEIDRQMDIIPEAITEVAMDILDMVFELFEKALNVPFDDGMQKKAVLGLTGRINDEYDADQDEVMNLVKQVDSPEKADRLSSVLRDAAA